MMDQGQVGRTLTWESCDAVPPEWVRSLEDGFRVVKRHSMVARRSRPRLIVGQYDS